MGVSCWSGDHRSSEVSGVATANEGEGRAQPSTTSGIATRPRNRVPAAADAITLRIHSAQLTPSSFSPAGSQATTIPLSCKTQALFANNPSRAHSPNPPSPHFLPPPPALRNSKNAPFSSHPTAVRFSLPAPASASPTASHSPAFGALPIRGASAGCSRRTLSVRSAGEAASCQRWGRGEGRGSAAEGERWVGAGYLKARM